MEADSEVWAEFRKGSQEAFRILYDTYTDTLFAFGLRYTTDHDLIRDCIHDLFLDLHTHRTGLTSAPQNLRFYLLKSFRRKLHLMLRKSARFQLSAWLNPEKDTPFLGFAFSSETTLIAEEQRRESLATLAREIDQLPSRQQEILYLKFKQELDYEEIATLMQVSVPTCRTLVYRAVKQLREKLTGLPVVYALLLFLGYIPSLS